MAHLFDGYARAGGAARAAVAPWDEMFADPPAPDGEASAREPYREIHRALARMTQEELRGRTDALASSYLAQGVTFDFAGEERPFPLDAVPRVIEADEWRRVERGIQQRVRATPGGAAVVGGLKPAVFDGVFAGEFRAVSSAGSARSAVPGMGGS